MSKPSDHLEMAFRSIHCFSNDGVFDVDEFHKIVAIAERDDHVTADEKRVLQSIISKLTPAELTKEMQVAVAELRAKLKF